MCLIDSADTDVVLPLHSATHTLLQIIDVEIKVKRLNFWIEGLFQEDCILSSGKYKIIVVVGGTFLPKFSFLQCRKFVIAHTQVVLYCLLQPPNCQWSAITTSAQIKKTALTSAHDPCIRA